MSVTLKGERRVFLPPTVYITIPLEGRIAIHAHCAESELPRLLDDIRSRPVARELVLDAIDGDEERAAA
jgi:hypothetical protein